MEVPVSEVAQRLGVSAQRVRAMLRDGRLHGRRVGGIWFVDEGQLLRPRRLGRPLSSRNAWAVVLAVARSGAPGAGPRVDVFWPQPHTQNDPLSQPDRSKLRQRLNRLVGNPDAPRLLSSWLAGRAQPITVSAPEPAALVLEPDLVASGVSDARAEMSGGGEAEYYAQPGTLPQVLRRHLLVEDPKGQVILREAGVRLDAPVPLLLLAADLADRGGPREMRRAAELIEEWAHPES
jgi:hypothetical protein